MNGLKAESSWENRSAAPGEKQGKKEGTGESRVSKYCYPQKNCLPDGSGLPKLLGGKSSLKIQDFHLKGPAAPLNHSPAAGALSRAGRQIMHLCSKDNQTQQSVKSVFPTITLGWKNSFYLEVRK